MDTKKALLLVWGMQKAPKQGGKSQQQPNATLYFYHFLVLLLYFTAGGGIFPLLKEVTMGTMYICKEQPECIHFTNGTGDNSLDKQGANITHSASHVLNAT